MAPPLVDFDRLTAPVPGDSPAGQELPFDVRRQLNEGRKEPDPFEAGADGKRADWPGLIRLASDTLADTSKDLSVATRLVEGLTKQHGFAGLRDGLRLLAVLCEQCWDRLLPPPEEGDEARAAPFNWLNDATSGARFPYTVATLPLFEADGRKFTSVDWGRPAVRPEMEAALEATKPEKLQGLVKATEEMRQAREELVRLGRVLDQKLNKRSAAEAAGEDVAEKEDHAPNLVSYESATNIGHALTDCLQLGEELLKRKGLIGGPAPGEPTPAPAEETPSAANVTLSLPASATASRDALYRQVEQIADALQKLEPHSPIPYLLKRAVRLGRLDFPKLMRAIIRETGTLDELDRLLGLGEDEEGVKG